MSAYFKSMVVGAVIEACTGFIGVQRRACLILCNGGIESRQKEVAMSRVLQDDPENPLKPAFYTFFGSTVLLIQ